MQLLRWSSPGSSWEKNEMFHYDAVLEYSKSCILAYIPLSSAPRNSIGHRDFVLLVDGESRHELHTAEPLIRLPDDPPVQRERDLRSSSAVRKEARRCICKCKTLVTSFGGQLCNKLWSCLFAAASCSAQQAIWSIKMPKHLSTHRHIQI